MRAHPATTLTGTAACVRTQRQLSHSNAHVGIFRWLRCFSVTLAFTTNTHTNSHCYVTRFRGAHTFPPLFNDCRPRCHVDLHRCWLSRVYAHTFNNRMRPGVIEVVLIHLRIAIEEYLAEHKMGGKRDDGDEAEEDHTARSHPVHSSRDEEQSKSSAVDRQRRPVHSSREEEHSRATADAGAVPGPHRSDQHGRARGAHKPTEKGSEHGEPRHKALQGGSPRNARKTLTLPPITQKHG
jgi:hypothetical protein